MRLGTHHYIIIHFEFKSEYIGILTISVFLYLMAERKLGLIYYDFIFIIL